MKKRAQNVSSPSPLYTIDLSCVSEQICSPHHNKENGKNNKAPKKIREILALKIWLTVISVAELNYAMKLRISKVENKLI